MREARIYNPIISVTLIHMKAGHIIFLVPFERLPIPSHTQHTNDVFCQAIILTVPSVSICMVNALAGEAIRYSVQSQRHPGGLRHSFARHRPLRHVFYTPILPKMKLAAEAKKHILGII